MAINTSISSCIALNLVSVGFSVGGCALVGSSFTPVGAAASALFGAISYIAGAGARWACIKIFNLDNQAVAQAAEIVILVAGFFARIGAGLFALTLAGFTITIGPAIAFSLVSLISTVFLFYGLRCCCGDPRLYMR